MAVGFGSAHIHEMQKVYNLVLAAFLKNPESALHKVYEQKCGFIFRN